MSYSAGCVERVCVQLRAIASPASSMPEISLKHFILRTEVLKLYRACMRAARSAPEGARGGCSLLLLPCGSLHGADHASTQPIRCLDPHITRYVKSRKCADGAIDYLRQSFSIQRHKTDYYDIKYALSDGREQLKKWQEALGMAS